jgi:CRP-like cAMP-binding protein
MPLSPLVQKLQASTLLTDDERQVIRDLPLRSADIKADEVITREGDRPTRSCLLLDGMTCSYKVTGMGKQQIVGFHLPGDIPDLQSLYLQVLDHSIATLTHCKVVFVLHDAVRNICARYPRIAVAFWRGTLVEAAISREWITNIGHRSASSRIAHMCCELFVRCQAVGLAKNNVISFPITQAEIADVLGLSTVHVNRSLQFLRASKLIELRNGELKVLDWNGLRDMGDFDPTYLHLGLLLQSTDGNGAQPVLPTAYSQQSPRLHRVYREQ